MLLKLGVKKTALDNERQINENLVNAVLKSIYMDDYLDSLDDPQTAVKTITDVVALLKRGSFDLARFISNSCDILKKNVSSEFITKVCKLRPGQTTYRKGFRRILGPQFRYVNFRGC